MGSKREWKLYGSVQQTADKLKDELTDFDLVLTNMVGLFPQLLVNFVIFSSLKKSNESFIIYLWPQRKFFEKYD